MDVLVTCKYEEDTIKNEGASVLTTFFPIITLWELSVAMDTRFGSDLAQNLMQPFLYPNDGSDKNFVTIGPLVAEIFKFENVYRHTNRHTHRRQLDWYTISSPLSLRLR